MSPRRGRRVDRPPRKSLDSTTKTSRLAALLSIEVVGFSYLMDKVEAGTARCISIARRPYEELRRLVSLATRLSD
jgi:hypothetical protein